MATKITKTPALTKTYVDSIKKAQVEHHKSIKKAETELQKSERKIKDRITFILNEYYKLWGGEVHRWNFGGEDEYCDHCNNDDCSECNIPNSIWDNSNKTEIYGIYLEDRTGYDDLTVDDELYEMGCEPLTIVDKNGKDFYMDCEGYDIHIPLRWLFEDFSQEITEGKKKYEEKIKKSMTKAQKDQLAKKSKEAEMLKHLKQRLTKDEIDVLRANVYKL